MRQVKSFMIKIIYERVIIFWRRVDRPVKCNSLIQNYYARRGTLAALVTENTAIATGDAGLIIIFAS